MTQVTLDWSQMRYVAQFSALVQPGWCISVANLNCNVFEGVWDEQIYDEFDISAGDVCSERLRFNERRRMCNQRLDGGWL